MIAATMESMTQPVVAAVDRRLRCLFDAESRPRIVVAVSGGSDSVGLLRALHELAPGRALSLSVAHLNHGIRGGASDGDAAFVGELARSLGLPFDVGHWRPARAGHLETDARAARYAWLSTVAAERGAGYVAVGHTRDDQAETILHRILRGTGPRGLRGIPARRPLNDAASIIRPLLRVNRKEIRSYLQMLGQPFRDDESNSDTRRTRSRLRHDLLPKLAAEYNPRVSDALVRLGMLVSSLERRESRRVEAIRRRVRAPSEKEIVIDRARLLRLPLPLRAEVLRACWRGIGWSERHMNARRWLRLARRAGGEPGRFSAGHGIDAWVEAEQIRLAPAGSAGRST